MTRIATGSAAFAAALGLLLPGAAAAQESDVALVHRLLLDQQMVVTAGADTRQAALGERLDNGDLIVTSSNTRAAIRFTDDGSLVRLNPNSRLQVRSEGERGAVAKTLELEFGELWARVTEQRGTFQVQTPSGVAAVKGTEFVVRVDGTGATTIITLEGAVDFFNGAGTVEVAAGRRAAAASATALAEVADLEDEERDGLGALIEDEAEDDVSRIEIPIQNAEGVVRTLVIELPRDATRALLGGGEQ